MKYLEKIERPWGMFYVIHDELNYKLKRIEVNPGQRLSYQYHEKRSESWTIIEGAGTLTLEGKNIDLIAGDSIIIPIKAKHRITNKGLQKLVFLEVQTGSYFGEDDIIRIEDDYNRK
ncbi:phosphomannose isomerase type II C-terminal cupin domain [Flavobacteriaceae bacterium]|nr:phosphomannose isomerase type II C-terminal cupin domain [Flavobacteriaceae bacterium]